jgi:AraC-like DNA-binding protein
VVLDALHCLACELIKLLVPWRLVIIFCRVKERLHIPKQPGGWLWRYNYSGAMRQMHRHTELELNLVTRGSASYLVNERRYTLHRHTLIWLFPGQDHLLLDESSDYQMWILVFKPRLLHQTCATGSTRILLQSNPQGDFCRPIAIDRAAKLVSLFEELKDPNADPALLNAGLGYGLMSAWTAHLKAQDINLGTDVHPAVDRAARLIRDNPAESTLDVLADRVGLSPSRLSRLFKEQTGVPLVTYRQRQCLDRFFLLYRENRQKKMLSAALAAGFGSYPQFHRVFKRFIGCSPADYAWSS